MARSGPNEIIHRARSETRSLVACSPRVFRLIDRDRPADGPAQPLGPDTVLVIDGFQSSGNSFAIQAFQAAQDHPVAVAGHVHSAGLIVEATRRGTPVLLLLRLPADAVASTVSRWTYLSVDQALRHWIRFHRTILGVRDGIVVTTFDEITSEFGAAIARLNQRFGTVFAPFHHTDENVNRIYAPDLSSPERVARRQRKEAALAQLAAPTRRARMAEAARLYATLTTPEIA